MGHARKIGADIACSLINREKVHCPIIYTTDADAFLPQDYFKTARVSNRVPFRPLRKHPLDKIKAFHDWFDAFKTLKFIHALRDTGFSMQSYNDLRSYSPATQTG